MKLVFCFVIFLLFYPERANVLWAVAVAMKFSSKINSNNDDVITLAMFSVEIYCLRLCVTLAFLFMFHFVRSRTARHSPARNANFQLRAQNESNFFLFKPSAIVKNGGATKWIFMIDGTEILGFKNIIQFCLRGGFESVSRTLGGLEKSQFCVYFTNASSSFLSSRRCCVTITQHTPHTLSHRKTFFNFMKSLNYERMIFVFYWHRHVTKRLRRSAVITDRTRSPPVSNGYYWQIYLQLIGVY